MEIFPYTQYQLPADSLPDTAFPNGHTVDYPLIDIKVQIGSQITPNDITVLVDSGAQDVSISVVGPHIRPEYKKK